MTNFRIDTFTLGAKIKEEHIKIKKQAKIKNKLAKFNGGRAGRGCTRVSHLRRKGEKEQ